MQSLNSETRWSGGLGPHRPRNSQGGDEGSPCGDRRRDAKRSGVAARGSTPPFSQLPSIEMGVIGRLSGAGRRLCGCASTTQRRAAAGVNLGRRHARLCNSEVDAPQRRCFGLLRPMEGRGRDRSEENPGWPDMLTDLMGSRPQDYSVLTFVRLSHAWLRYQPRRYKTTDSRSPSPSIHLRLNATHHPYHLPNQPPSSKTRFSANHPKLVFNNQKFTMKVRNHQPA